MVRKNILINNYRELLYKILLKNKFCNIETAARDILE